MLIESGTATFTYKLEESDTFIRTVHFSVSQALPTTTEVYDPNGDLCEVEVIGTNEVSVTFPVYEVPDDKTLTYVIDVRSYNESGEQQPFESMRGMTKNNLADGDVVEYLDFFEPN